MANLATHTGSSDSGNRAVGHVFLSYAAEDAAIARLLADELMRLGVTVWWDRLIAGGAPWSQEIERALHDARAVIVLWSPASVASHFVRAEARTALERKTLIPATIEPCELPMPFGEFQSIDLTAWRATGDPVALDDLRQALDRVESTTMQPWLDAISLTRGAALPWRVLTGSGIADYAADLVHMITAAKAFLRQRSAEPRLVATAARFFGFSVALEVAIGLPLAMKIGGSLSWELLGAAFYQPMRMLFTGIAIHLSWRTVGGRAPALKTLATFAYVYGVLVLLYGCTLTLSIGLFRATRPALAERAFAGVTGGNPEVMVQVISEVGMLPAAALLLFAISPLFVVPFLCWGAFRQVHQVSRARSIVAAAIALVLAGLAYWLAVTLSYFAVGPG
jgi:hypothetical protein